MPQGAGGGFDARPPEIRDVGDDVSSLAEQTRNIDLHGPLEALASALPGGLAAGAARNCKLAGAEGVRGWATAAEQHAAALTGSVTDYETSDRFPGSLPPVLPQLDEQRGE